MSAFKRVYPPMNVHPVSAVLAKRFPNNVRSPEVTDNTALSPKVVPFFRVGKFLGTGCADNNIGTVVVGMISVLEPLSRFDDYKFLAVFHGANIPRQLV